MWGCTTSPAATLFRHPFFAHSKLSPPSNFGRLGKDSHIVFDDCAPAPDRGAMRNLVGENGQTRYQSVAYFPGKVSLTKIMAKYNGVLARAIEAV